MMSQNKDLKDLIQQVLDASGRWKNHMFDSDMLETLVNEIVNLLEEALEALRIGDIDHPAVNSAVEILTYAQQHRFAVDGNSSFPERIGFVINEATCVWMRGKFESLEEGVGV